MEFISHAVKDISQLKEICKDGSIKSSHNLIKEGKFLKELTYDYFGDNYVGYTSHVMCSLGLGYLKNKCPAAILFKANVINRNSILYPKPYKYEFFIGLANILWKEQKEGKKDWKKFIEELEPFEREGFPPFKKYMKFFFEIPKKPFFENAQYESVWGPSVYSESFIKLIIPELKKSQIQDVKSKIKSIKGSKIKSYIKKAKNENLPYEILLDKKVSLDKAYGFAVKKKYKKEAKFLSNFGKEIIFV